MELSFSLRHTIARFVLKLIRRYATEEFRQAVLDVQMHNMRVFGDQQRLTVHSTAQVNDALFNLASGSILVGKNAFFGHGVSVITGTHDVHAFGEARRLDYPKSGRDIVIEEGVWVGSNVTILGPCRIGRNSVVGAMALVNADVPAHSVVVGIPAKIIRTIPELKSPSNEPT